MIFARKRPAAVEKPKATTPMAIIMRVWGLRKMSADMVRPTEVPRKMVTMFISSLEEVFTKRSTTPASLKMLPSMSMMIRAEASGTTRMQTIITITANTMRSALLT